VPGIRPNEAGVSSRSEEARQTGLFYFRRLPGRGSSPAGAVGRDARRPILATDVTLERAIDFPSSPERIGDRIVPTLFVPIVPRILYRR